MDLAILVASSLVITAILSTRATQRFGLPALVLFVVIGMLAGSSGPGGIVFDDYGLSLDVGLVALAVILFSGGLDTRMRLFKASLVPAISLSTGGVLITMLVIGGAAWLLTPLDLLQSLLLGAVLAPTDAAATFSVLKGRGIPARLRGVLEAESGTNDPVGIYLTIALTSVLASGNANVLALVGGVIVQLVLGGVLGYLWGIALVWLLNNVKLDGFGLYPLLALASGLLAYSVTDLVGGNGFLAIYLMGLVVGNHHVPHRQNLVYFMEGLAWGAQIVMFLLLGLLVFPDQLPSILPVALLITLVMMLIARPLAVYLCLEPLRRLTGHYDFSWREYSLLSGAGLKGAVPIILAIFPLLSQVENGEAIFNIVFVVVVVSTTVQGLVIGPLAQRLDLLKQEPPESPLRIELGGMAPPGSAVLDVFLEPDTRAVGQKLRSLRLSQDVIIAAIYRDEQLITPRGDVVFQAGDHVFVITRDVDKIGVPSTFTGRRQLDNESSASLKEAEARTIPDDEAKSTET